MTTRRLGPAILFLALGLMPGAPPAWAADPGTLVPDGSPASDQRRGSVLFYNLYTSGSDAAAQDTRLALTNASDSANATVRLFLVDGATRTVTNSFICLTPRQTVSLNASSLRAGSTGYAVAVAINPVDGCPVSHNHLIGQALVRFPSGFRGLLEAVGVPAQGAVPPCVGPTTALQFNGVAGSYGPLPRTAALTHIGSREDDALTLLALNRVGGDLGTQTSAMGTVTGVLYDDVENAFGYSFVSDAAQVLSELTDAFPVTAPPFETAIPLGRTGWTRLSNQTDVGLLGAAMTFVGQHTVKVTGPTPGPPARR